MKNWFPFYSLLFFFGLLFQALGQQAAGTVKEVPGLGPEADRGYRGSFHFGVTTAINSTWIQVDSEAPDNKHYQYNKTFKWAPIGLAAGYKFNDRHDLQAEVYLSPQGQHYDLVARGDGSGAVIGGKRVDLTYLQVPLLWNFTSGDATRFNVHFGPQVGFLIRGEEVNAITRSGGVHRDGGAIPTGTAPLALRKKGKDTIYDGQGKFNKVDPYWVLGFGLEKDITDNLYLSGMLRFHYGFGDIRAGDTLTDKTTGDLYRQRSNIYGGLQFGLHYMIRKP
jgi:hypothetical protein